MKISARANRLASTKVTRFMPMKPAVIVSSLNGTGVAPAIRIASKSYSRRWQAAIGNASVSPSAPISQTPTVSYSPQPIA